jgi:hypothetical protein
MTNGIAVYDMAATQWSPSGPTGIWQQNIRSDRGAGRWFGGVRFEPLSRSGVHRHLGPAASFMLSGSLVDHATRMVGGQAVINLTGAVHDVICYDASLFVARVDGPILYPRDTDGAHYRSPYSPWRPLYPEVEILRLGYEPDSFARRT